MLIDFCTKGDRLYNKAIAVASSTNVVLMLKLRMLCDEEGEGILYGAIWVLWN